jgi:hypothetical protein
MSSLRRLLVFGLATGMAWLAFGQAFRLDDGSSITRLEGGNFVNEDTVRTARETVPHSVVLPAWTNPEGFEKDVFTFARVLFRSDPSISDGAGRGRRLGWWVDYPDADLNLSHRLQQMTSMAVDPDARVIRLTDPDLVDYPFIFMVHIEGILLDEAEEQALRGYLQRGGALMITDFWGTASWERFKSVMQRVLPERSWVELDTTHPVFRSVFEIKGPKHRLRIPTMQFWDRQSFPDDPDAPLSVRHRGQGSETMKVWAMLDDQQRIMAVALHNSDVSDGWERESEDEDFFRVFSEPIAYPLAINFIYYLMTH